MEWPSGSIGGVRSSRVKVGAWDRHGTIGTKGGSSICACMYFLQKVDVGINLDLNMSPVSPEPRSSSSLGAILAADVEFPKVIIHQCRDGDDSRLTADQLFSPALFTLNLSMSRMYVPSSAIQQPDQAHVIPKAIRCLPPLHAVWQTLAYLTI